MSPNLLRNISREKSPSDAVEVSRAPDPPGGAMSSPTSVIRDWRRGVGGAASDLTPSTLVGAEVRFRGLVSRNDLNGAFGKVKGWIEDRGRLEVRIMDRDGIEGERDVPVRAHG